MDGDDVEGKYKYIVLFRIQNKLQSVLEDGGSIFRLLTKGHTSTRTRKTPTS